MSFNVFGFLMVYPDIVSVTIFSVLVLILINIFYRVLINQNEARQIKEKTKELNKQMRTAQKAGNKEEANKLMSDLMKENSRMMKFTIKPMMVSFIIVIIFLPWLSGTYGDRVVGFDNSTATFSLKDVDYHMTRMNNTITFASGQSCDVPCTTTVNGEHFSVSEQNDKVKFSPVIAMLPFPLPFVGTTLGWFGWYLIVSIPMAMLIRRLMKIYV